MKRWILGLLLLPITAVGADRLEFGKASSAGTGCAANTAQVKFRKNAQGAITRVELIARRFQVSAGGGSAISLDRKSCQTAIPFELPAGKTLAITSLEVAGNQALAAGATSDLKAEAFVLSSGAQDDSTILQKSFSGPLQKRFYLEKEIAPANARCASEGILRANVAVVNRSGADKAKALTRLTTVAAITLKVLDCE